MPPRSCSYSIYAYKATKSINENVNSSKSCLFEIALLRNFSLKWAKNLKFAKYKNIYKNIWNFATDLIFSEIMNP